MKNYLVLTTAICAGLLCFAHAARAQEIGSLYYYDVSDDSRKNDEHAWRRFFEYNEHREQCQHYQDPPAGYALAGCTLYRVGPMKKMAMPPAEKPVAAAPMMEKDARYTLHFSYDSAAIADTERAIIDKAAQDISKSKPSSVTVSGYASTPGTDKYNMALSERRADSVKSALVKEGVDKDLIKTEAYGETHLAVPQDGTHKRQPANRRVTIGFERTQ